MPFGVRVSGGSRREAVQLPALFPVRFDLEYRRIFSLLRGYDGSLSITPCRSLDLDTPLLLISLGTPPPTSQVRFFDWCLKREDEGMGLGSFGCTGCRRLPERYGQHRAAWVRLV